MTLPEALGLLALVVGVPLNVYVALKLRRMAGKSNIPVLHERATAARVVLLTVTVFAALFVNNDQPIPPLDLYTTKVASRIVILVLATVPALRWLRLFRRRPVKVDYKATAAELKAAELLRSKGWDVFVPSGAPA